MNDIVHVRRLAFYYYIAESFCMLALGKTGEKVSVTFLCDDHYRPTSDTWECDLYTFSSYQRRGIIHKSKLELRLEAQGAYARGGGGIIAGFYSIN